LHNWACRPQRCKNPHDGKMHDPSLFFFFSIILHSSYIAYGTSAIFSTTSMAYSCALASIFDCTILLAVPTLQSRHSFWARRPPTFLALCYCITFLTPLRHLTPLPLRFHPCPTAQCPTNQLRQIRQQLLDSCISKQVRRAPLSTGPCLGFQPIPYRLPLVEAEAKPLPARVTRCLLLKHTSPAFRPDERSCLFVYRHAHPFSRAT